MSNRKMWVRIGNKLVNPENTLAVKTILAGQRTQGVTFNHRSSDEREIVAAAIAKRERKRPKKPPTCLRCARVIYNNDILCVECRNNKRLCE